MHKALRATNLFTLAVGRSFILRVETIGVTLRLPLVGEWFADCRWRVTFSKWAEVK